MKILYEYNLNIEIWVIITFSIANKDTEPKEDYSSILSMFLYILNFLKTEEDLLSTGSFICLRKI